MRNIAACIYNCDIIFLDLNNDDYYLIESNDHEIINEKTIKENLACLGEYEFLYLNLTDAYQIKKTFTLEERWSAKKPSRNLNRVFPFVFKTIWYSFKLNRISRQVIKNKWHFILNRKPTVKKRKIENKKPIINYYLWIMRKIFYFNNEKTDCLTTSVALQHFLAKKGISGVLVLGVKSRPFFAHAWIEVDGEIINDDINLRKLLSVILEVNL